jgi:hypothetical protein
MGLAAAPCVRLKRPFTLCHCDCVLHELSETTRVKLPILAVAQSTCQKAGARNRGVLQFAGLVSGVFMQGRYRAPFGFSPKISTPVENTVEKQAKRLRYRWKCPIYRDFRPGEGR